ncbi:hypothetical protein JTE90_024328 [Oedothorax gibbosus]|uniref:Uncharacterized protein n=1 Tax=Oedothorax gibbosus TaxID=931172 RepID=A0AAV6VZL0_9ARAC|nr:hypothetical protein JTE90_024328 [Oedothorax gibbosus]
MQEQQDYSGYHKVIGPNRPAPLENDDSRHSWSTRGSNTPPARTRTQRLERRLSREARPGLPFYLLGGKRAKWHFPSPRKRAKGPGQ